MSTHIKVLLQRQMFQELLKRNQRLADEAKEKREQRKLDDVAKKKTAEEKKKKKKDETVTEKTACGSG